MIDIHCHILYDVDDGAEDAMTSRDMIDRMAKNGVTDIFATAHFRRHMFYYPIDKVEEALHTLKRYAFAKNVRIHAGCEYHVDHEIFDNLTSGRVHSMADTSYVLTEYSYSSDLDRILHYTQELLMRGWHPIIAHVERYEVFQRNPLLAEDVVDAGAQIQVNADAVLGLDGRLLKKTTKKLLAHGLVDYIASDAHDMNERASHMKECFDYVGKKYGPETADALFEDNARRILQSEK